MSKNPLSNLAPQYMFAIVLALTFAIAFAIYTFLIQPGKERLTELQNEQTQKEAKVMEYRQADAAIPQLETQVEKLKVEREEFINALPKTAEFSNVAQQIRGTVVAAGTDLKSLGFSADDGRNEDTVPGVRPMNMNLSVSGQFNEVFNVLRQLETQNRFTTVQSIEMQMPEANSYDPDLDSSFSLKVYTFDPNKVQLQNAGSSNPNGGTQ